MPTKLLKGERCVKRKIMKLSIISDHMWLFGFSCWPKRFEKRLYRAYRLVFAILEFREGEMIFSLSSALPN